MAGQLIAELQRHNVKYVVAPYEADAQLAYLERKGIIQGILSEDSDLLVFGCKRLLTKLDQYGECIEICRDHFTACKSVSLVGWTDTDFRRMAILSGCDYVNNINGLGLKTAYSLLRKFKTVEKVVQRLQFDSKYSVPANYLENFRKAELTFLHQWVFCPIKKGVVMNTQPPNGDKTDLSFLGVEIDPSIACGVAYGRLHPTTKQPLKVPEVVTGTRRPSRLTTNRQAPATPLDAKIGKPIDTFFKPRRVPLTELDPNTFTPSPSQQRLQQVGNRTWLSSPVNASPLVPTPSGAVPTTVGPDRTRRSSKSVHSASASSKRRRLCGEDEADGYAMAEDTEPVRSKFFSAAADRNPVSAKFRQSKASKENMVNIWSDDAIDGILSEMVDISQSHSTKLSIFEDATPVAKGHSSSELKTQASNLTVSSENSTQTVSTSLSFGGQPKSLQRSSLFHRFSLVTASVEANPQTAQSSKETLSSQSSHRVSRDDCKKKSSEESQQTEDEHIADCMKTSVQNDCAIPDSPVDKMAGETGRIVESPVRASHSLSREQKTHAAAGSEDCLVPQSDEDGEEEVVPVSSKLELGRFVFSG